MEISQESKSHIEFYWLTAYKIKTTIPNSFTIFNGMDFLFLNSKRKQMFPEFRNFQLVAGTLNILLFCHIKFGKATCRVREEIIS